MSTAWDFGNDPFPAFRANLVYGQNKRARAFLPVVREFQLKRPCVVTSCDGATIYEGTDKAAAEAVTKEYNAQQAAAHSNLDRLFAPKAILREGPAVLPEGKFRIIKTKEKGTTLVVPGDENTNRCLLFVGCEGGFRGGVRIMECDTTGALLAKCEAGNACDSSVETIALLDVGQSVAFHTWGRRTNEVYAYTWTGVEIETKHFSKEEWDVRNGEVMPAEDVEVL